MFDADFARGTLGSVSEELKFKEWFIPGLAWWLIAPGFGFAIGLALWPISPTVGVIGAIAMTALTVGLLLAWSPRILVEDGVLYVGPAHIECKWLGQGTELTGEPLRTALGPELDARTWVCVRPWVKKGLLIENLDPQDPAPAWIIASRRPSQLLKSIENSK